MHKIKYTGRNDRHISLHQGSTFCKLGTIISFELSDELSFYLPIKIDFTIKKDYLKKSLSTELSEFINDSLTVTYYNPAAGTSGPVEPISLLENDQEIFKLAFQVNKISNSDLVKLSYEFLSETKMGY